jgi:hypothetical protein
MIQKYHFNINIPVNFNPMVMYPKDTTIKSDTEIKVDDQQFYYQNNELTSWLKSLGLRVEGVRYFESVPYTKYKIHTDSLDKIAVKLNFVYDSHNSEMLWFEKKDTFENSTFTNVSNEQIPVYEFKDLREVYRVKTDTNCLINGGLIHQLVNSDNMGVNRKCFSLKLEWVDKETKLTWYDAVEVLKDYVV